LAVFHLRHPVCEFENASIVRETIKARSLPSANCRINSMTFRPVSLSRALVGSSQTINQNRRMA
jgi:hypothetical protein